MALPDGEPIPVSLMSEEQMLEELKNWDEEAWQNFKRTKYEVINLDFIPEEGQDVQKT